MTWSGSARPRCSSCPARAPRVSRIIKEVAGVNIPPLLQVSGLFAGVQGAQNNKKGTATAAAHVATVNIGNGQLVINGIRGVATVTRNGSKVTRSTAGTKVLEVLVNGTPTSIPLEQLDLPGLVELEENIVKETSNGLTVVALRIHLLDGSLAVIDLGTASVGIKRAQAVAPQTARGAAPGCRDLCPMPIPAAVPLTV